MACNLYSLHKSTDTCMPSMPGTGDYIYVFDIDKCFGNAVPSPKDTGFYDAETFAGKLANDGCIRIDIKTDSGQVTSEKAEGADGRSLVGTAIVDHSTVSFLATDEALGFRNVGALIPDNNGNYYVIMSPYARTKYSCNYDSGTTYDSDHGFTITFTASPVFFAAPKVKLTTTQLKLQTNLNYVKSSTPDENAGG